MSISSDHSDLENVKEQEEIVRLGECEVCGAHKAIYTCPKCEVKTCCLDCVRIHKKELQCNGIRDRSKFVRIKDFTDTDLLSDYRMLEECSRFVYALKRDEKKKFTRIDRDLPYHLYKLKMEARKRGIVLQYLAQNFTRNSVNTTRYNFKANIISWRVEWIFPNVDGKPLKFVDPRCNENIKLSVLLDKYLNTDAEPLEGSKALSFYRSAGFSGIKVLLKAEKVKESCKKFFELDPAESLAENLSGKCIIEFPIIFVVLKDHAYNFEIAAEDDFDFQHEKGDKPKTKIENTMILNEEGAKVTKDGPTNSPGVHAKQPPRKKPRQLLTQQIAEQKKLEIEKEIKEQRKKRAKNLLFTTGYSSEESLGDLSDENGERVYLDKRQ